MAKFFFVQPACSPVAAQLIQVSQTGYACGRSFRSGGAWGASMEVEEDFTLGWFFPTPEMALEASEIYSDAFGSTGFDTPWIGLMESPDGVSLYVVRQGGWVVAEIPIDPPQDLDYEAWAAQAVKGMRPVNPFKKPSKGGLLEFSSPKELLNQITYFGDWKFPVDPGEGYNWTAPRQRRDASLLARWKKKMNAEYINDGASGTIGLITPDGRKIRKQDL